MIKLRNGANPGATSSTTPTTTAEIQTGTEIADNQRDAFLCIAGSKPLPPGCQEVREYLMAALHSAQTTHYMFTVFPARRPHSPTSLLTCLGV